MFLPRERVRSKLFSPILRGRCGLKKLVTFDETLFKYLKDDEFAVEYLQDALDDNFGEFVVALGKLVRARIGEDVCTKVTDVPRNYLDDISQSGATPNMDYIFQILKLLGMRLTVSFTGD